MQILCKKKSLATLIAAASGLSGAAFAEENSDADRASYLETVTVVGQATNVLVTSEELESYQANDLADVFRLTPSISVGGSLGIAQKVFVRGLEDNFVNVTVDGAPQTSTLFHHIGRVSIDPGLLKEVEVQAGAGEATSGAGAIGGAIRFRTKDVNDLLEEGKSFGGQVKGSYFSNDGEHYSVSLYGRLTDDWGVLAYYNDTNRDNFKDGDGDEVLGTASDQSLGFLKISGNITDNQYLSLSYEDREEEADFSARPNWHVRPGDLLYASEATRETFIANYTLEQNEFLNLEVALYDTESSFNGGRFDWLTEISTYGFDIRNTSQLGNHRLTYGVDYRDDEVESGPNGGSVVAKETGDVLGVYAQVHSQLTDRLLLSYGARYDGYDFEQEVFAGDTGTPSKFDDSDVSFNAGFAYQLTEEWSLGLGYAEAFRGKEIGDGFTIDSKPPAGGILDQNLEGESVTNIEASAEYSGENLNVKVAVFESEIDDVIFEFADNARGFGNYFQNIGALKTQGFEVDLVYLVNAELELYLGFSALDSKVNYDTNRIVNRARQEVFVELKTSDVNGYEHRGLGNSQGDSWNIGLNYTPRANLQFGLNVSYVEELEIDTLFVAEAVWGTTPYELEKDSYTVVDIFAEWQVTDELHLNLAVINLFDEQYRDHSSVGDYSAVRGYGLVVGPWEAGRDIRLSVSYSF